MSSVKLLGVSSSGSCVFLQGETGPAGPSGAPGTRGTPVCVSVIVHYQRWLYFGIV